MIPAETVQEVVGLVSGREMKIGDYSITLPDGADSIDFRIENDGGDIVLTFTGVKPIAQYYIFKDKLNGLRICAKGVRVDVMNLPAIADPFRSWDEIYELY